MPQAEENCPECGGRIHWRTIHHIGAPIYNGHCPKCNIVFRNRETPQIAKGKRMAKDLIGVHCMDKRITSQPCDVQIGILRAKQHCKTCQQLSYNCKCIGCNCICCMESKEMMDRADLEKHMRI